MGKEQGSGESGSLAPLSGCPCRGAWGLSRYVPFPPYTMLVRMRSASYSVWTGDLMAAPDRYKEDCI